MESTDIVPKDRTCRTIQAHVGMTMIVEIDLPWSATNELPDDMQDWLATHVGEAKWAVSLIRGNCRLKSEQYSITFEDATHACLFKLTWSGN
jgi:hypothetical protein